MKKSLQYSQNDMTSLQSNNKCSKTNFEGCTTTPPKDNYTSLVRAAGGVEDCQCQTLKTQIKEI